ncbi:PREDICTED: uncharacterized protein LOC108368994, partial [Rhagoletis zephyria]|uniref:uncharacterized protein LOC108368994 n=1 Tax=Rhagoletis zephyria TaxID=28612 RepID=UPI000811A6C4
AYALPNYIESELLLAQMRAALIDTRTLTPAESTCATKYKNSTRQINNWMTSQTNACFENANHTLDDNNTTVVNQNVAPIRERLEEVQQQLANCTAITDVLQFLNCTTASFDNNIHLLDKANTQASQVEAQIAAEESLGAVKRHACVSAIIGNGKTNLTTAANDYQTCLSQIANQSESHMVLY